MNSKIQWDGNHFSKQHQKERKKKAGALQATEAHGDKKSNEKRHRHNSVLRTNLKPTNQKVNLFDPDGGQETEIETSLFWFEEKISDESMTKWKLKDSVPNSIKSKTTTNPQKPRWLSWCPKKQTPSNPTTSVRKWMDGHLAKNCWSRTFNSESYTN